MKKLLLLSGLILICLSFTIQSQAGSKAGKITFLKGVVKIQRKGSIIRASRTVPIKAGDIIIIEEGSAQIKLSGGARIHIRSHSRVVLSSHFLAGNSRKTKIKLTKGSLYAKVKRLKKGSFSVITPSATAGVRGTEFYVEVREKKENGKRVLVTIVEVLEGIVAVKGSYGKEIPVAKNQGVEVSEDSSAPEPKSVLPKKIRWR